MQWNWQFSLRVPDSLQNLKSPFYLLTLAPLSHPLFIVCGALRQLWYCSAPCVCRAELLAVIMDTSNRCNWLCNKWSHGVEHTAKLAFGSFLFLWSGIANYCTTWTTCILFFKIYLLNIYNCLCNYHNHSDDPGSFESHYGPSSFSLIILIGL